MSLVPEVMLEVICACFCNARGLMCLQVFEIPFNSANKWSLAVTNCPGDKSHQLVMMKGAPEIILTKCSHHLQSRQEKEIDEVGALALSLKRFA